MYAFKAIAGCQPPDQVQAPGPSCRPTLTTTCPTAAGPKDVRAKAAEMITEVAHADVETMARAGSRLVEEAAAAASQVIADGSQI